MKARQQSFGVQASPGADGVPSRFVRHLPELGRAAFLLGRWTKRKPLGPIGSVVMWSMLISSIIGIGIAIVSLAPVFENTEAATPERVRRGLMGAFGFVVTFTVFSWLATKPALVRLTGDSLEADSGFDRRIRVPLARIQELEVTQMDHPLGHETWMIVVHSPDRRVEFGQGLPKADLEWVRDRLLDEMGQQGPG